MTDTAGRTPRRHSPAGTTEPRSIPDERAAAAHLPYCSVHHRDMEPITHSVYKNEPRARPLYRCALCVGIASAHIFMARTLSRPRYADLTEKRREQKAMQRRRGNETLMQDSE